MSTDPVKKVLGRDVEVVPLKPVPPSPYPEPVVPAVDPEEKKPAMVDPEPDTLPRIEPDPKKELPDGEPPATPREGKRVRRAMD
jgi:hypothetical protein